MSSDGWSAAFFCLIITPAITDMSDNRAYAYSKEVKITPTENERSVNLVLETVLEFSDSDNSADIKFLDEVVNFITRVKSVIKDKNSRRQFKTQRVESFTDFIQEVVGILNTYNDPAFQDFFDTLDAEIRKYHYRGCKFYELTDNIEIRKLIGTKLDLIRGKSVLVIKTYINVLSKLLREENYDDYVKELVDYINSLYRRDDRDKFNQVLSDLENYNSSAIKGANKSLSKIISDGVRSIVFNHYTDLNFNARRELKNKIETFLKQYKQMVSLDSKRNPVNVNIYKDGEKLVIRAIKKPTTASLHETEEITREKNKYKEHNRSAKKRIDIKMSDYNNKHKSRFIIMRNGIQEQNVPYVEDVKINNEGDKIQDIETKLNIPSARKDVQGFQRTTEDDYIFSSDEPIEGASVESNSIEFFQEQMMEANTQRYMTLYPEEIISTPMTTEKSEKNIRAARIATRRPKLHTLWIEESTGRLQNAVLDEMTIKLKPRHNKWKHVSKQKHRSKHERKHGSKYAARHNSEYKSKHKLRKKSKKHGYQRHGSRALSMKRKNKIYNDDRAFSDIKKKTNMKFYDDEKMFEPERIDKHESSSKSEYKSLSKPTKAGPSRHLRGPFRSTRRAHQIEITLPAESGIGISDQLDVLANRYEKLTGKKNLEFRRKEPPSFERTPVKQFDKYKNHKVFRKITKNKAEGIHVNMDPNFVKRIINLEKEIKEVKSKITGVDTAKVTTRKIMERYKTKDESKIGIKYEDKNFRAKEMQLTNKEFKPTGTVDTRNEYRTELKFSKGKDSKFNETKELKRIEIKHDVTQIKSSKVTKMVENKNLTEIGNAACLFDINSKCKEMATHAKTKPLLNYNMDDKQKDTKPTLRPTMKSTASNATGSTKTQTTTIKATITEKPTEIKTTPTRKQIFIPVSMSFAPPSSTKPPIITSEHTKTKLPIDYNDNMMKNPIDIEMDNYFEEPHTKTMDELKFKNNQINNMINVTMPTVNTENLNATRSLVKESTSIDLKSGKDFTISSPPFLPEISDTTPNFNDSFLYTDPFSDLDNDLDFMKGFG